VQGNKAYVTGETRSDNYPTTSGAFDTTLSLVVDAFVTKLNAAGSALSYSTYLGGDSGNGIAVGGTGKAYVTGETWQDDYPTTRGAFDRTFNDGTFSGNPDAFVTKLSTS
jgi:hypothetical protein